MAKLWDKGVWDPKTVREWSQVAREHRQKDQEVHMGRLFGIVVEKGAELPPTDPRRKYKGRVVFQGNKVVNQDYQSAVFSGPWQQPSVHGSRTRH